MFNNIIQFIWNKKYISLFISLFIIVLTQRFLNERQNGLINSVSSDGLGYYCYLPAAVIYQDFSYDFYDKKENNINPFYKPGFNEYKNQFYNKYYCGTAICLLPFFLLGIIISAIAGTDINGYTDTFLMLVSIASIIYYLLSVFMLSKIAKFFGISEKISFITSLLFLFGTNYFHYLVQEPSMSHAYSFFAVTLFLYTYIKLLENVTNKKLIYLALALGLVALIRPVNVVVVLFTPFFSESLKDYALFLKNIFTNHLKGLIGFISVVVATICIQFIFYYLQTGYFYIVSYNGEAFNFNNPEFFNVLLSYKKGLFLYVPLLLATIIFVLITKKNWHKKIIFLITFMVFLYITSSWWCWYYGAGLSIRPFVDILPLFIIITMFVYNQQSSILKKIVMTLSVPFLFMSQLMAYQYSNLILDIGEMNKEKYWDIFLETNLETINAKKIQRIQSSNQIIKSETLTFEDDVIDNAISNIGYNSKKSCVVGKNNCYSKGFCISLKELTIKETFYVIAECYVKTSPEGKNLALAVSVNEKENCAEWFVVFRNQFDEGKDGWTKMTHVAEIKASFINDLRVIKIFGTTEKGENYIDNLKYTIVKK